MNDATPHKIFTDKGLTRRQKTALKKVPPLEHIKTRQDEDKTLAYLEGWYVIAEANRIFGPENWDRITLATQSVWQGRINNNPCCAYTARVRICVRAGLTTLTREGSGFGQARGRDQGEAHGLALKAAETDATKRALSTLGAPFGLMLYDPDHPATAAAIARGMQEVPASTTPQSRTPCNAAKIPATLEASTTAPWIAFGAAGEVMGVFRDPILCCSAIRRTIEGASSVPALEAVYQANRRTMARLYSERPELRSDADQHYTHILSALFQTKLKRYATTGEPLPNARKQPSQTAPI